MRSVHDMAIGAHLGKLQPLTAQKRQLQREQLVEGEPAPCLLGLLEAPGK